MERTHSRERVDKPAMERNVLLGGRGHGSHLGTIWHAIGRVEGEQVDGRHEDDDGEDQRRETRAPQPETMAQG